MVGCVLWRGGRGTAQSDGRPYEGGTTDFLNGYAVDAVPSIHIIVRNGEVALEGTVSSAADKNLATARTNGLANVRSVKNNLRVQAKVGGGE